MVEKPRKLKGLSSASGGPATAAGIDFQVDFAVSKALGAIARFLVNPLEEMQFSMEPRIISVAAEITLWDLRISPPDTAMEAKLHPKRQEVLDWLDNVEAGANQAKDREFELMYGRGALPIITAIERLKRIADESSGDADMFAKLVGVERIKEADVVLAHLKTEPYRTLTRLRVTPTDSARSLRARRTTSASLLLAASRNADSASLPIPANSREARSRTAQLLSPNSRTSRAIRSQFSASGRHWRRTRRTSAAVGSTSYRRRVAADSGSEAAPPDSAPRAAAQQNEIHAIAVKRTTNAPFLKVIMVASFSLFEHRHPYVRRYSRSIACCVSRLSWAVPSTTERTNGDAPSPGSMHLLIDTTQIGNH